jgi:hypothetical protein
MTRSNESLSSWANFSGFDTATLLSIRSPRTVDIRFAEYIPDTLGVPQFLFATSISKHSARPIETTEPLSAKIGVPIDSTYADQDYSALASQLLSDQRFASSLIVVCWHHGNIPSMAHALRANAGSYPDPWDPQVFNQILVLSYSSDDAPRVTTLTEPF